ncbi:aminodeoxychorismate synthase component I [Sulfuriflexus mobilis]|uniref:aminodeoxychorismate synthase component I n=1 Tax=Sulfuriflexus mobilis TaxID=1811807 RepID=UPI000F83A813|nr:aminodeoxychorismate synthase component I [Sulfuriflexus mobilis]
MNTHNRESSASVTFIEPVEGFPDLLALHEANPQRYPYLLESVAHGNPQARYDILFAFPGESLVLDADMHLHADTRRPEGNDFLSNLDAWWREEQQPSSLDQELPFRGGWFIFLAYELAGQIEPVLDLPRAEKLLPTALATRIPLALVRDHVTERCWLVGENVQHEKAALVHADLDGLVPPATSTTPVECRLEEEAGDTYIEAVEKIRRYIVDGDVFQVNLSRKWQGEIDEGFSDANLYRALRRNNPAPFAGLMHFNGSSVISSSPERLVQVHRRHVETRPIAGTRPRGEAMATDRALSEELLAHPKERAEHIMLIDLERNDLGRVCEPGSVEVNELMVLESYAHVHHIVSNVRGELREAVTPGQVIAATFPGGTITGCPKVRCMAIIAELEHSPREAYTGSMGYLNLDGDMDLNILIRTMIRRGKQISLRAGAGIVADSVPHAELQETRAKARGLLRALGLGES